MGYNDHKEQARSGHKHDNEAGPGNNKQEMKVRPGHDGHEHKVATMAIRKRPGWAMKIPRRRLGISMRRSGPQLVQE